MSSLHAVCDARAEGGGCGARRVEGVPPPLVVAILGLIRWTGVNRGNGAGEEATGPIVDVSGRSETARWGPVAVARGSG